MKENKLNVFESMKTGIVLWVVAHLLLYLISGYVGDFEVYNNQILKLLNPINFAVQVAFSALMCVVLRIVYEHFVDNLLKAVAENKREKMVQNITYIIIILALLFISMYFVKELDIINKAIMKLMVIVIAVQAIAIILREIFDTAKYNKKLHEANSKK